MMTKVSTRVIGRPYRGNPVGTVLSLSRRDAQILTSIGRAERVDIGETDQPKVADPKNKPATEKPKKKRAPRKKKKAE